MISPLIKGWKVLKKICNNQIKNLVQEKKFRRMELMRSTQRTMAINFDPEFFLIPSPLRNKKCVFGDNTIVYALKL